MIYQAYQLQRQSGSKLNQSRRLKKGIGAGNNNGFNMNQIKSTIQSMKNISNEKAMVQLSQGIVPQLKSNISSTINDPTQMIMNENTNLTISPSITPVVRRGRGKSIPSTTTTTNTTMTSTTPNDSTPLTTTTTTTTTTTRGKKSISSLRGRKSSSTMDDDTNTTTISPLMTTITTNNQISMNDNNNHQQSIATHSKSSTQSSLTHTHHTDQSQPHNNQSQLSLTSTLLKHQQFTTTSWCFSPSVPVPLPSTFAAQIQQQAELERPMIEKLLQHQQPLIELLHDHELLLKPEHIVHMNNDMNDNDINNEHTHNSINEGVFSTPTNNKPMQPTIPTSIKTTRIGARSSSSTGIFIHNQQQINQMNKSNVTNTSQQQPTMEEIIQKDIKNSFIGLIQQLYLPHRSIINKKQSLDSNNNIIDDKNTMNDHHSITTPTTTTTTMSDASITTSISNISNPISTTTTTTTTTTTPSAPNSITPHTWSQLSQSQHQTSQSTPHQTSQQQSNQQSHTKQYHSLSSSPSSSSQTTHDNFSIGQFVSFLPWLQGFYRPDITTNDENRFYKQILHEYTTGSRNDKVKSFVLQIDSNVDNNTNNTNNNGISSNGSNEQIIDSDMNDDVNNNDQTNSTHSTTTPYNFNMNNDPTVPPLPLPTINPHLHSTTKSTALQSSSTIPTSPSFPLSPLNPTHHEIHSIHKYTPISIEQFSTPIDRFLAIVSTYLSHELSLVYNVIHEPFKEKADSSVSLFHTTNIASGSTNGNNNNNTSTNNNVGQNNINNTGTGSNKPSTSGLLLTHNNATNNTVNSTRSRLLSVQQQINTKSMNQTIPPNSINISPVIPTTKLTRSDKLSNDKYQIVNINEPPQNSLIHFSSSKSQARRVTISLSNLITLFQIITTTPTHPLHKLIMFGTNNNNTNSIHFNNDNMNNIHSDLNINNEDINTLPNVLQTPQKKRLSTPTSSSTSSSTPTQHVQYQQVLSTPLYDTPIQQHQSQQHKSPQLQLQYQSQHQSLQPHSQPQSSIPTKQESLFPFYRPLFHRHSLVPLQHRYLHSQYIPIHNPLFDKFRPFTTKELKNYFLHLIQKVEIEGLHRLQLRTAQNSYETNQYMQSKSKKITSSPLLPNSTSTHTNQDKLKSKVYNYNGKTIRETDLIHYGEFFQPRLDKDSLSFPVAIIIQYAQHESEFRFHHTPDFGPVLHYELIPLGKCSNVKDRFFGDLGPIPSPPHPQQQPIQQHTNHNGVPTLNQQLLNKNAFINSVQHTTLNHRMLIPPHPNRTQIVQKSTNVPFQSQQQSLLINANGTNINDKNNKKMNEKYNERYLQLLSIRNQLDHMHPSNNLDLTMHFNNYTTQFNQFNQSNQDSQMTTTINTNNIHTNIYSTPQVSHSPHINIHQLPTQINNQQQPQHQQQSPFNPILTSLQFYPYSFPIAQTHSVTTIPTRTIDQNRMKVNLQPTQQQDQQQQQQQQQNQSTTLSTSNQIQLTSQTPTAIAAADHLNMLFLNNQFQSHPLYSFDKFFFECVGELVLYSTHTDYIIPNYIKMIEEYKNMCYKHTEGLIRGSIKQQPTHLMNIHRYLRTKHMKRKKRLVRFVQYLIQQQQKRIENNTKLKVECNESKTNIQHKHEQKRIEQERIQNELFEQQRLELEQLQQQEQEQNRTQQRSTRGRSRGGTTSTRSSSRTTNNTNTIQVENDVQSKSKAKTTKTTSTTTTKNTSGRGRKSTKNIIVEDVDDEDDDNVTMDTNIGYNTTMDDDSTETEDEAILPAIHNNNNSRSKSNQSTNTAQHATSTKTTSKSRKSIDEDDKLTTKTKSSRSKRNGVQKLTKEEKLKLKQQKIDCLKQMLIDEENRIKDLSNSPVQSNNNISNNNVNYEQQSTIHNGLKSRTKHQNMDANHQSVSTSTSTRLSTSTSTSTSTTKSNRHISSNLSSQDNKTTKRHIPQSNKSSSMRSKSKTKRQQNYFKDYQSSIGQLLYATKPIKPLPFPINLSKVPKLISQCIFESICPTNEKVSQLTQIIIKYMRYKSSIPQLPTTYDISSSPSQQQLTSSTPNQFNIENNIDNQQQLINISPHLLAFQQAWFNELDTDPTYLYTTEFQSGLSTPFEHTFYLNRIKHPNLNPLRYNLMPCAHQSAIFQRNYDPMTTNEMIHDNILIDQTLSQQNRHQYKKKLRYDILLRGMTTNMSNIDLNGNIIMKMNQNNNDGNGDGDNDDGSDQEQFNNNLGSISSTSATEEEASDEREKQDQEQFLHHRETLQQQQNVFHLQQQRMNNNDSIEDDDHHHLNDDRDHNNGSDNDDGIMFGQD